MSTRVVIVTGSRNWPSPVLIHRALDELRPDLVVHGGCKRIVGRGNMRRIGGADWWAHTWCEQTECDEVIFRARWGLEGKRAGMIRNQRMLDAWIGATVVAAPLPGGRGTQDCMRRAQRMRMPVIEVRLEGA